MEKSIGKIKNEKCGNPGNFSNSNLKGEIKCTHIISSNCQLNTYFWLSRLTWLHNLFFCCVLRADLVPVYSFGENELFPQVVLSEGSVGRRLQALFKQIMGFAPCLFTGGRWLLLPFRRPVTTVGQFERLLTSIFSSQIIFLVATLTNLSAAETANCCMIPMFLCVFQWAIPLQCLRLTVHLRNRWIITTVYTWRLCLNFSTDIRPAADWQKHTSCASYRKVGKHKVNETTVWNIMWDRYKKRKIYLFLYWCHVNVLAF